MNEWKLRAACFDTDTTVFFDQRNVEQARAICRTCNVQKECLQYASQMRAHWGIWAGYSARERSNYRQARLDDISIEYKDLI